ncbi:hypothetical protein HI806_08500 [Ralstonia solanacearum]|uniref:hypothetical protein n=1 Tax=Ralstonia pseudosolanacearum TaxID=1310165 RepID=UPI000578811E|nr:hypothetical protein BCR16_08220 [Ralstonia solanacearum FJAT-1458]QKL71315.1 hypothetical protein HI806_08500 [Ralstonia solanacearum]QKL76523.1 hypothetical protein HI805_08505 [Ralstonia solanacearum]QKL81728.1 hypothetical protein HI804_08510 [Ralstonia solanacearum]QKL86939.1 hypothetical protein HI803_08515 [Ralstonia solanacearum]
MATNTFQIKDDDDAWQLLSDWLDGHPVPPLDFAGWPHLSIKIQGAEYKSSLRSGQMEALIGFKSSMGRAYAAIAHGAYDKRRLKKSEDEQLEFTTTVKKGSSIADTDLTPLVHAVAQLINTHPMESLIAAVAVGLTLVARPMILKHFDNKAKQMEIEERDKLLSLTSTITTLDRKRWDIMEKAVARLSTKFPAFDMLIPDVASSYWHLAAASADADRVDVGDVTLNRDHLEILAERRARRNVARNNVTDTFVVEGIVKIGERYRLQLRSPTYHFSAIYHKPHMTESRIRRLFSCMTDSKKIEATVEIKVIEKSQIAGQLLKFKVVNEQSEVQPVDRTEQLPLT